MVTMLPPVSKTVTAGWGANAAPLAATPNAAFVNAMRVAGPVPRTTLPLSPLTVPLVACRVYVASGPTRLQPAKVATPEAVETVVAPAVQVSVGMLPLTVSVIEVGVVTVLLAMSCTVTWGCGASAAPLTAAPNAVLVNARCVAAPKEARTTSVLSPMAAPLLAWSVYVAAGPVTLQPAKVATPVRVPTVLVVQLTVAAPPLTDNVMAVGVVTVLPPASATVTSGWGASGAPLTAGVNAVLVNTRWVAVPVPRTMLPLSAVKVPLVAWSV